MRATVNFSLKRSKSRSDGKCPVYVRCTMNNQRFELSTGIFVVADSWDESRQQVAGNRHPTRNLRERKFASCIGSLLPHETTKQSKFDNRFHDQFCRLFTEDSSGSRLHNSSDIQVEAFETTSRIRYRIDGKLVERYQFGKDKYPAGDNVFGGRVRNTNVSTGGAWGYGCVT